MNTNSAAPLDPVLALMELGRTEAMYSRAERERVDAQTEVARLRGVLTDVADVLAGVHDGDLGISADGIAVIVDAPCSAGLTSPSARGPDGIAVIVDALRNGRHARTAK